MKRRWNAPIWTGFLIVLSALPAYLLVFARFPLTRDVPWVTLLMFALGFTLMGLGLWRAWRDPHLHRGRVAGTILAILGVALFAFFEANVLYFARQLPTSGGTPRAGARARDFTLPDQDGRPVALSRLLGAGATDAEGAGDGTGADAGAKTNGVVLVFYRGFW